MLEIETNKEEKEKMVREMRGNSVKNGVEKTYVIVSERVVSSPHSDLRGRQAKGMRNSEAYDFGHPSENLNRKNDVLNCLYLKKRKNLLETDITSKSFNYNKQACKFSREEH